MATFFMRILLALVVGFLAACAVSLDTAHAQALEARPDTLTVPATGYVFHPGDVLLANDVKAPEDSLLVIITSQPANGTLTDVGGGSFRYDPNDGFLGDDFFRYSLETVPIQRLTLDPSVSVLSFDATVETALGVADDDEEIPVGGTIDVAIGNDPAVIDSVHVLDTMIQNQGSHSLNFSYGSPISIGSLRIIAEAGDVRLTMLEPGPASGVSGVLNSWEQAQNLVHVSVTAELEGGGLITNQVPDAPQQLVTETTESLTGATFVSGGQILFLMNVVSSNAFDLDGNAVTLDIAGSLQATGTFVASQSSNEAEVLVQVVSGASVEDAVAGAGFELDLYPTPVSNWLTVRTRAAQHGTYRPTRITIYDVLGRVVERRELSPYAGADEMITHFDASNWASGLYVVHANGSRGSITRSIIRH